MHTFRSCLSVVLGSAIFAAALVVTGAGPDGASAAPQVKERVYQAKFECTIPATGANCSVTLDKEIPAGMRLRIESIEARIVVPAATKSSFEFYVDFGDPGATGSVGSIHVVPKPAGSTDGRFYDFYSVSEKVQAFAYRTGDYPAPRVHLNNPTRDPLNLQNGTIQDGVLGGHLVGIE